MNSIDIIIPTMWKEENLPQYIEAYCNSKFVNNIFLIDNNHESKPKSKIFEHEKITSVSYGRNIYVNPAWNEGYYRCKSDVLCILNDDIYVEDKIFSYMSALDFTEIDLIGVHLKGSIDNYHIVDHPEKEDVLIKLNVNKKQPIGGQSYAFGVCMFIKKSSYRVIPSLYQIWFGDDYLIQHCKNIYTLKTSKIKGEISKTIVAFDKESDVNKRIILDSKNAYTFNHFLNSKNWDLVKQWKNKED